MLQMTAPPVTRYDYEQMPDGPPYFQVIEGDLIMSPSPSLFHQDVAGRLYSLIMQFLDREPVGQVFVAPVDVFLSDTNVYQPDVVFVSQSNRSRITERGIEGAPDLVVEIVSPSTARYDRGSKRKIYARTGVKELWLVDPETRTMEVFDFGRDAMTPSAVLDAHASFATPLLPGLKLELATVFKASARA